MRDDTVAIMDVAIPFLFSTLKLCRCSHENLSKLLRHEMSDFVNYALDCTLITDDARRKVTVADFLRRQEQILLALTMAEGGGAASRPFSERSLVDEAFKEKTISNGAVMKSTDCVEEFEDAELL